jgi:hypothetical protein
MPTRKGNGKCELIAPQGDNAISAARPRAASRSVMMSAVRSVRIVGNGPRRLPSLDTGIEATDGGRSAAVAGAIGRLDSRAGWSARNALRAP